MGLFRRANFDMLIVLCCDYAQDESVVATSYYIKSLLILLVAFTLRLQVRQECVVVFIAPVVTYVISLYVIPEPAVEQVLDHAEERFSVKD
jgi:hypothetical protein